MKEWLLDWELGIHTVSILTSLAIVASSIGTVKRKIPIAVPLMLCALAAAIVTLSVVGDSRRSAHADECVTNLKTIQGAKILWAMENPQITNSAPSMNDLCATNANGYTTLKMPLRCPNRGEYSIGRSDQNPACTLAATKGHKIQ